MTQLRAFRQQSVPPWRRAVLKVGSSLIAADGGGLSTRYALGLAHKHIPEMTRHAGLTQPPLFSPSVARFYRGMLVEVPLQLWSLPGAPKPADLHAALADAYAGKALISVAGLDEAAALSQPMNKFGRKGAKS